MDNVGSHPNTPVRNYGRRPPTKWSLYEIPVYVFLIGIVTIRTFTEQLPILPRVFNAFDIVGVPFLLLVCFSALVFQKRPVLVGGGIIRLAGLFVIAWVISWLVNFSEVHWIGALLLPFGLLSPIVFYLVLINLNLSREFCRRTLVILRVLLFANLIVGTLQVLIGGSASGPDIVFGTFGVNIDQFAFFMALMLAYLAVHWLYHKKSSRFNSITIAWTASLFLMATFQTLWVVLPVSAVIVFMRMRVLSRRFLAIPVVALLVIAVGWPLVPKSRFDVVSKLQEAFEDFDRLGKVELVENVPKVWAFRPWSFFFGVGPGSFNSRAFRSIAKIPYVHYRGVIPKEDVSAAIVEPFYSSEVADHFIIPYFMRGAVRLSGENTDAPFTSFISVPVEIGVPGALVFFAIYGVIILDLDRAIRRSADSEERVLGAWALMSLLILLGIAVIDNSLEVNRYTLIAWLSVALRAIYSRAARKEQMNQRQV